MFDLKTIEDHWIQNYKALSERDIQTIYTSELNRQSFNKLIEGTMYIVFDMTRIFYNNDYKNLLDMETIFNLCEESLVLAACQYKKGSEPFVEYVTSYMKTYIDVYLFKNENNEVECISTKPTELHYMTRNEGYVCDYTHFLSDQEFKEIYAEVLQDLPYLERESFRLSFNNMGDPGLTNKEISDYLGTTPNEVNNAKKRALTKLKNSEVLKNRR